jgi:histidine ammonia-lyase
VVAVAHGARVELGEAARQRIAAGRAIVDAAIDGPALIYGLNTGLGHLRDERVPIETLRDYQDAIVRSHAGGIGARLAPAIVRAAMVARVAGMARGGSGATTAAAETLIAMLNAGVDPHVPQIGSVGASDLMHMAAIALVAIGAGRADVDDESLDGGEALRRAGIEPLRMEPKDALALISANGVSIGHGALVVARAARAADAADLVAALSFEAIRGNPSVTQASVAAAKAIPGQIEVARRLRSALVGSALWQPDGPASLQDPLSFRVVPQVHGAFRELLAFTRRQVDIELDAMDDNPLVSIDEGRMISNGNFHPMLMALTFDALRPAIAHVGKLSDLRNGHLWTRAFSDPALSTVEGMRAPTRHGAMFVRYAGAARYAELRLLAGPATLDIPSLDLGVEDHATGAPLTVQRTDEALDRLDDILAIELLAARDVVRRAGRERMLGHGTAAMVKLLDALLGRLPLDATTAEIVAEVRALLASDVLPDLDRG